EDRRVEHRRNHRTAHGLGIQVAEHFLEREGMHRPEREDERLLARRRLQLEVEALAEFLPEREAPGLVDAAAQGRVQHELHAARLVEEALQYERLGSGNDSQSALALREIGRDLLGGGTR